MRTLDDVKKSLNEKIEALNTALTQRQGELDEKLKDLTDAKQDIQEKEREKCQQPRQT